MHFGCLIFLISCSLYLGQSQLVPESPCPNIFRYLYEDGQWKGLIDYRDAEVGQNIYLTADFTFQKHLTSDYVGAINLLNPITSVAKDVLQRRPLSYEILFPVQFPIPKLKNVVANNQLICSGPTDKPPFTTIKLRHDFKFDIPYQSQNPNYNSLQQSHVQPPSSHIQTSLSHIQQSSGQNYNSNGNSQRPSNVAPSHSFSNVNDKIIDLPAINKISDGAVCGKAVSGFTQSLVLGGEAASRGEWPWLVAIFKKQGGNSEFFCGGSLVSSTFVVSAAHCLQDKGSNVILKPFEAEVVIGKYNLEQFSEPDAEIRNVKRFIINPDWSSKSRNYDGDISLIELDRPVAYSQFIRPICLWSGSSEINQLIGQRATLAGWGKNDRGSINTQYPKKVDMPIVSDGVCLRSNEVFVHITSLRNFCAGGKNEGPCSGDSGGGLFVKNNSKYYLRGIVSASLTTGLTCDVNSYAIFTDVAQFVPWIKQYVS